MKAGIAATLTLAAALGGSEAMAGSGDGNQLITACQTVIKYMDGTKNVNSYDFGYCIGIVEAVEGSMIILNDSLPTKLKTCFPEDGITNGQKARIVVKSLQENPATLNQPATYLTMLAFKTAYPCE